MKLVFISIEPVLLSIYLDRLMKSYGMNGELWMFYDVLNGSIFTIGLYKSLSVYCVYGRRIWRMPESDIEPITS